MSLICGALKWLVDSEEREKAKMEAVLSGKLPPSALEEQTHQDVATGNSEGSRSTASVNDESNSAKPGIFFKLLIVKIVIGNILYYNIILH